MLRGFKFRLEPTKEQIVLLYKHAGCSRFVYNYFLDKKINHYTNTGTNLSTNDCIKTLPSLKKEYPWLKEVDSTSLQQSLRDLNQAFQNFFREKNKSGFPNFKSKHRSKQSFRITNTNDMIQFIVYPSNRRKIKIGKLGFIKYSRASKVIKKYSNIKPKCIKSATVSRDSNNHWYVSLTVECENQAHYQENNNIVGIDLGIKNNYTIVYNQDDNNLNHYIFDNPKGLAKYETKLARLQRKLSKRVRGSNNYNKLKLKIGKLHYKIKSIRRNFNHLISKRLVESFQIISIEDLNIKKMMMDRKHVFGKKLSDLAFYQLRMFLTYKCQWYGRTLSVANRYLSSSKICSSCGYKNTKLTLKDRDWTCPNCKQYHNRDINAAMNLYGTGLITYNTGKMSCKDKDLIALIAC